MLVEDPVVTSIRNRRPVAVARVGSLRPVQSGAAILVDLPWLGALAGLAVKAVLLA